MRRLHRNESGFMLVELLAAMLLLTVLVTAFSELTSIFIKRDGTLTTQSVLATEARATLDQMSNELRAALCNDQTAPVTNGTTTSITFTTPDRQQPYHLQQITYTLSSGALTRQVATSTNTGGPPWTMGAAAPAERMAPSITNTTVFHYYDSSGSELAAPLSAANLAKVAKVTMTLVAVPDTASTTGSLTAQSSATLRTPECYSG